MVALVRWSTLMVSFPPQMKPYNIYVTVAFPPDTDTPLLAEENKSKVNKTCFFWIFSQ